MSNFTINQQNPEVCDGCDEPLDDCRCDDDMCDGCDNCIEDCRCDEDCED